MRSPVLIAETPFAGGHGSRFLAPPGRQVDSDVASYYIGRVREVEDNVEEIEGEDYLAVVKPRIDEATTDKQIEIMVLAGIDVDRMSGEERDEVLDQLRERLDVLNDALAAVDWSIQGYDPVVEIPELDEWHEAAWDALPRTGPWADPEAADQPRVEAHQEAPTPTEEPEPVAVLQEPLPEPDTVAAVEAPLPESEPVATVEEPLPEPEPIAATPEPEPIVAAEQPPAEPEAAQERIYVDLPFPDPSREPSAHGPVTVIVQVMSETPPRVDEPVPDVIVPAREPEPIAPIPVSPRIDPIQVSASHDRSPALADLPTVVATAPLAPRRGLRWYIWFPWTAVALFLVATYFYVWKVDRTWNQRVHETHFVSGATKLVETPGPETIVEKPVERIVEKRVEVVVDKPIPIPILMPFDVPAATKPNAEVAKTAEWMLFEIEYTARMGRQELASAGEMLDAWQKHLPAFGAAPPLPLNDLKRDYREQFTTRVGAWLAGRVAERRFADGYEGLTTLASSKSVGELIGKPSLGEAIGQQRLALRAAEDQYHYTQIRTLAAQDDISPERIQQHINAYLSLVEPPGVMLAEVQQLEAYRQWLKDGRPAKATVKLDWGGKALAREHAMDISFSHLKDGVPIATFTRSAAGDPGKSWSETFSVSGVPGHASRIAYRVKTSRRSTPVEELAEAATQRTELFMTDPSGVPTTASEVDSGTKVSVDWQGLVSRPALPAWNVKTPAVPVSLPK